MDFWDGGERIQSGDRNIELAWAAGFFDGEGTTSFHQSATGAHLYLSIGQTSLQPLERFRRAVEGIGKIYGPIVKVVGRKPMFYYQVQKWRDVKRIIVMLDPFLCNEKRDQARCAVEKFDNRPLKRQAPDEHGRNTQCPRGHVYELDGVYVDPRGRRECAVCRALRRKRWSEKSQIA